MQTAIVSVLGVLTVVGSIAGARIAGRSSVKAAQVAADAGAYTRAQEIYESSISELRRDVDAARADAREAKEKADENAAEVQILRRSVARYEGRTVQLEATLRQHGIPVPAWGRAPTLGVLEDSDANQPPMIDPERP